VFYHDPHVPEPPEEIAGVPWVPLEPERLRQFDCAAVITGHSGVDYRMVLDNVPVLVDTRNVTKGIVSDKIVKL
jgi:UDP-N-acetyl-D-glucosamine dehydrogenase